MIPPFNRHGYLPEGIHRATMEEIDKRFGGGPTRGVLMAHLRDFLGVIKTIGARRLILDGSFVTVKEEPRDIDVILVLPEDFNTRSREARLLLDAKRLFNIHLVPVSECDEEFLGWWLRFFGTDRDGFSKGFVGVEL